MITSKSLFDIPARARTLAANSAVPTGHWTLAQICDHLARAVEGSLGLLAVAGGRKRPPWPVRAVGRFLIMRVGIVPGGVRAPEHVLPPADVVYETALGRLQQAIETFERRAGEPDAKLRSHPIFGFSDAGNWRKFHLVHARHHLGFMKVPRTK